MRYIIQMSGGRDFFWSSEFGWTDRAGATVFTQHERDNCNFPIDGKWVVA